MNAHLRDICHKLPTVAYAALLLCSVSGSYVFADQPASKIIHPSQLQPLKTQLPFHSTCGAFLSKIPPNDMLVTDFAQKAAIQAFTYDYKTAPLQLSDLERCFTIAGWKSFSDALKASGNIDAASKEHLFASAITEGEPLITDANPSAGHWEVLVPLKVRYENEKSAMEQHLKVKLVVAIEDRRLGIDQLIATASGNQSSPQKDPTTGQATSSAEEGTKDPAAKQKATDVEESSMATEKSATEPTADTAGAAKPTSTTKGGLQDSSKADVQPTATIEANASTQREKK